MALGEAERAQRGGDSSAALAALERALHLALEHRTGLRTRGVLAADRAAALRGAGLDATEADEAARVLAACEEARFVPMGAPHDANHVFGEARALVKKLASHAGRAA